MKIIKISNCTDCPYLNWEHMCCHPEVDDSLQEGIPMVGIADFCPLDNVPDYIILEDAQDNYLTAAKRETHTKLAPLRKALIEVARERDK